MMSKCGVREDFKEKRRIEEGKRGDYRQRKGIRMEWGGGR
jgi:hypothetical protein